MNERKESFDSENREELEKRYIEEFRLNLNPENLSPESLFDEWPVDVKLSHERPLFGKFAAEILKIEPKEYLDRIKAYPRDDNHHYNQHHDGSQVSGITNRLEDIESKALFNYHRIKGQGNSDIKIIDYQIPLKPRQGKSGIGNIDLLGVDNNNVYLLEAKKIYEPNGHILHAVLQVYTYFRFLSKSFDRLKKEFELSSNLNVVPAIIFYKDSVIHKEFNSSDCAAVRSLMNKLGVHAFLIDYKGEYFESDKETIVIKEGVVLPSRDLTIEHLNLRDL